MTTTLRTRSLSIGGNRLLVLIVLVLLLQLALTAVFFNFLQNQHKASSQSDFQTQADTFGDAIQKGIDRNLNVVQSVSGLFATSDEVRRSDFRAFAQWPLSRYPDIHALEWIPRIKNSDRVS